MIYLHWHSHFSLFEWYWSPARIIEKAKNLQMSAIGLTDYYNLYGAIEFYEIAKKNDIKPIIGVEIPIAITDNIGKPNFLVLIAKSFKWYKNLLKLISEANIKYYENFPKINFQLLKEYNEDIFVLLGGPKSLLGNLILTNEKEEKIYEILKKFETILGKENIILELQPHHLQEYKKINNFIYSIGKNKWYIITISNNYHYINPEDKSIFWLMQAIKLNEYYNPSQHNPEEDFHIMNKEELIWLCKNNLNIDQKEIEKFLNNNTVISNQIDINIPLGNILFPKYQPWEKIKKLYETYKNQLVEKN